MTRATADTSGVSRAALRREPAPAAFETVTCGARCRLPAQCDDTGSPHADEYSVYFAERVAPGGGERTE